MEKTADTWIQEIIQRIGNMITGVQEIVLAIAGFIIVIMIVVGGIQYIMGQADAGKKTITAAVIGTIVIALSWAIYRAVEALFS